MVGTLRKESLDVNVVDAKFGRAAEVPLCKHRIYCKLREIAGTGYFADKLLRRR